MDERHGILRKLKKLSIFLELKIWKFKKIIYEHLIFAKKNWKKRLFFTEQKNFTKDYDKKIVFSIITFF